MTKSAEALIFFFIITCQGAAAFHRLEPEDNQFLSDHCGISKNSGSVKFKLIGTEAQVGEFPWAAVVWSKVEVQEIYYDGSEDQKDVSQLCSGTLISKRHVLTASHCFFNYVEHFDAAGKPIEHERTYLNTDPNSLKYQPRIGLGGLKLDQSSKDKVRMLDVNEIWFGSDAGQLRYGSDFAIVELEENIPESDIKVGNIVPICMSYKLKKETSKCHHKILKTALTIAAFGEPNPVTLRYDRKIARKLCPYPTSVDCPFCVCAQQNVQPPLIAGQNGDSGAGCYLIEERLTDDAPIRSHLWSIYTDGTDDGFMTGIGVLGTYEDPENIVSVVEGKIGLKY